MKVWNCTCWAAVLIVYVNALHAAPQTPDIGLAQVQGEFYRHDAVQSVHLQMTEADQRRMLEALPECVYVPASFRWRDTTIGKVAVRFKGNSSTHPQQQHKRSYLIRFDKYEENQRFFGLRRVSFDNGVQFGSLFSEPIITDLLRKEGITTHRSNYAKVFLNDQYQGVYVNVERIDASFIAQHFPDSDGSLWKNDLGGPGGNLQYIGEDPRQYEKAFESKNTAARENMAQLVEFIRQVNQSQPTDFASMLTSRMEVDDFLRITAVMLLSGAFDQLTGWGPHNYYLFHDAKRDRWRYLPWDLDVGFCELAFGHVHVLEDWNAAWPVPSGMQNPLLERIIADPRLLARYRTLAAEILESHFEPHHLCGLIDQKYLLIKADLQTDPFPHRRVTVPDDRSYDVIVESMKTFVRKRYSTARQQLKDPGQRPKPIHRAGRNHTQGLPPELETRIQQVMRGAQKMQHNLQEIHKLMQQIGPLVQDGNLEDAEKLIDRAQKLTE